MRTCRGTWPASTMGMAPRKSGSEPGGGGGSSGAKGGHREAPVWGRPRAGRRGAGAGLWRGAGPASGRLRRAPLRAEAGLPRHAGPPTLVHADGKHQAAEAGVHVGPGGHTGRLVRAHGSLWGFPGAGQDVGPPAGQAAKDGLPAGGPQCADGAPAGGGRAAEPAGAGYGRAGCRSASRGAPKWRRGVPRRTRCARRKGGGAPDSIPADDGDEDLL